MNDLINKTTEETTYHIYIPETICTRCIYDERTPSISFDNKGVCNYCKMVDELAIQYGTGMQKGEADFIAIVDQIKKAGKGKKYDCVLGVSGGTDSSYMAYLAIKWGLRPLAVHYDNTWNSAIATENIRKVLGKLDIDLYTKVVDNKEADDIFKAFLFAGVPELEASTDLGLSQTMYQAASKYGIKYILEGHSFITEGITPLGKNYFDGKYIQSIHQKFGKVKLKTFPNMSFMSFMKWLLIKRIKKIRPFWYIKYSKEEARAFLEKEFDWKYYGGHHLENRMTAFFHSYYSPVKHNIDYRNNSLSASVRSGKITREDALSEFRKPPHLESELLGYLKKRLGFTNEEFDRLMQEPTHSYKEYPTYKKRFERLRPMFALLANAHLVPRSFYLKYCFPDTSK